MFIGICEVNRRQYFCGMWAALEDAQQELAGAYEIKELPSETVSRIVQTGCAIPTSIRIYEAVDTGADRSTLPDKFPGFIGTDCDGFTIYEVGEKLPGYMPFDED